MANNNRGRRLVELSLNTDEGTNLEASKKSYSQDRDKSSTSGLKRKRASSLYTAVEVEPKNIRRNSIETRCPILPFPHSVQSKQQLFNQSPVLCTSSSGVVKTWSVENVSELHSTSKTIVIDRWLP
ncbi:unnamed protein product [Parnassius apollo]|uniref:(apollo) hypothetical protein n=1 Tax=Parnassius apollo TaxID=110799 RepID=A0A8S3WPZ7_PARAO|nr:unnamed protein product [Parnassius apollo]